MRSYFRSDLQCNKICAAGCRECPLISIILMRFVYFRMSDINDLVRRLHSKVKQFFDLHHDKHPLTQQVRYTGNTRSTKIFPKTLC